MGMNLIVRLRRRRAVSTLIGGVIVLSLLLTALGTEVFVWQQYDQYQQTVNRMAQYRNQKSSEYLVINSPGLTPVTSSAVSGWGSGCTTTYNCYNTTISNLGTVGVQIVRIYINTTRPSGSGCSYSSSYPNLPPCILNPTSTIAPYAFNQANAFINAGEANHALILALPSGVILPYPDPGFPENAILLVTSRGNMFTFQWPFQPQVFGQSQSAFSMGIVKVAYQQITSSGFDSSIEPAAGGSGGTGYCHTESSLPYPAGPGYAEKLTGLSGLQSGSTLWFVNPWITGGNSRAIMNTAVSKYTQVYFYVIVVNVGNTAYTPTAGTIDLTWYGSNHIDGSLLGVYYNNNFYPTSNMISIPPGMSYYAIYKISIFEMGSPPTSSLMLWGAASITNGLGSNYEDQNFYAGTILLSGLWIRYESTSGSCA
ncbi:MAG: hypothetical protein ABSE39_08775 [Candidatus Bathyarchaeia archaeon]|jgi:hypothetical protein